MKMFVIKILVSNLIVLLCDNIIYSNSQNNKLPAHRKLKK